MGAEQNARATPVQGPIFMLTQAATICTATGRALAPVLWFYTGVYNGFIGRVLVSLVCQCLVFYPQRKPTKKVERGSN
jgi:hypothetical protein